MIERSAHMMHPLLDATLVRRIRRNHGLEHATIHMLSRRMKSLRIAGRADWGGFDLYGEADTEAIWQAAQEALTRMRKGEHHWAVHPNCGTGLVTTGFLTSSAAMLGLLGTQNRAQDLFNRLPIVVMLSIGALVISQPIGLDLQRHYTTLGDPGDLELVDITRHQVGFPFDLTVHRVQTRWG